MIPLLLAASLAAAPGPADALPDGPGRAVLQAKCLMCHTGDYVTQQRLTPVQWQRTVEKMRKFGSPMTDDEVKVLSDYLAQNWPLDVPERRPAPVKAPAGAVSAR